MQTGGNHVHKIKRVGPRMRCRRIKREENRNYMGSESRADGDVGRNPAPNYQKAMGGQRLVGWIEGWTNPNCHKAMGGQRPVAG